jgi:hypothetical protein
MDISLRQLVNMIYEELRGYEQYMELDMPELAKDELKHAQKLMKLLKLARKKEVDNGD